MLEQNKKPIKRRIGESDGKTLGVRNGEDMCIRHVGNGEDLCNSKRK